MLPKLKRVKISSEQDLRVWLAKQPDQPQDVVIVTCNKVSPTKYVSRDQLYDALADHGWQAGRSYTMTGNLVGHVIHHA